MEIERDQKVQDYLDVVCSQIRFREMHPQITLELRTHMEETIAAAQHSGMPPEDAAKHAIRQMGDPLSLGKQLDRTHKPRVEWSLLALSGFFVTIGLISLYFMQARGLLMHSNQFQQTLPFTLTGIVVCLLLMRFVDYYRLKKLSWYIYWGTLLIWILMLAFGPQVKGIPVIDLGFISIDYSSFTPFLLVFALAGIFTDWDWQRRGWLIKSILLLLLPIGLGLLTPSISSVIMYAVLFFVLMIVSGAGWKRASLFGSGLVLLPSYLMFSEPYRMERVLAFLNPYNDPQGAGWIYIQALKAIHSAGMWGQGFTFPAKMMPEIDSNFIFTYIIYTFGVIAALLFVFFALLFVGRLILAARQIKDTYGSLLGTGIATLISIQFIWNILMATGKAPLCSIGLPFVSYGIGSFMIQMLALGMVLSAYRRKDLERGIEFL